MQSKISNSLLPRLQAEDKPYEVHDTELKGFLLRVQPTGTIAFYCSYRAADGKRNRVSLGRHPVVTPAQARDHAKRVMAKIVQGENPADKRKASRAENLGEFLANEFAPWVKAHRKDGEATMARLAACFGSMSSLKLHDISASAIDKWRTQRKEAGIATATINRDIATLRSALSKAVEWGNLERHPLEKVRPMKLDTNSIVRFLSEPEETRLRQALDDRQTTMREDRASANEWREMRSVDLLPDLKAVEFTDHLKPMILIAMNTGIRQGELFQLKWADVSLVDAAPRLTLIGTTTKSGKTRHVPLNKEVIAVLKAWHTQTGTKTLVFPNKDGLPFDNVKKSWAALLKRAEIVAFRWHDLRHHFASRLVMAGVDLNTVRELLGHADLKITLRYAHLAPEHKAAAVEKLVRV